ncbi:MAG TPA: alpha/beta hydrolase [Spirochaetota bacterium]|nr:alpha/beta hydrolase [Spirochaetota bacterium]HQE58253.1 alpha/beta hydrolase [Spirochaetota bacterium]
MKRLRKTLIIIFIVFLFMNVIAFMQSYGFTHYEGEEKDAPLDIASLSMKDKLQTLVFGLKKPRTKNIKFPSYDYKTIIIGNNPKIECWEFNHKKSKGTVIIFHGYGGKKSNMLDRAEAFASEGYSFLLVDFMGAGGSEGDKTTIGYDESEQVKRCYDYVAKKEKNIILFGFSMGAAAIMKAVSDYSISPSSVILECPFSTLYRTVCNRFNLLGVPQFPIAGMIVFWGGVQHGFWGFSHNPSDYAVNMKSKVLLLHGKLDNRVGQDEMKLIYENIPSKKILLEYDDAEHETIFLSNPARWKKDIFSFINS